MCNRTLPAPPRPGLTTVANMRLLTAEDIASLGHRLVYVGRPITRGRHVSITRHGHPLANPHLTLAAYRRHVESRPDLMALLPALEGKVLACWCCITDDVASEPDRMCHAEVLADLIEGRPSPC